MAIRTAHIALSDFGQQVLTRASHSEKRDCLDFAHPVPVIKLEDDGVGFATIDAGVRPEIVIDLAT
jgi:hypothetical protein